MFRVRRPLILDQRHRIMQLLIYYLHVLAGHHRQQHVINELCHRYWILKMRSAVCKAWRHCVCKMTPAKPSVPEMGPLPTVHVTPYIEPFTFSSLNYFGSLTGSVGRRHEKRYGALFTCFTTQAVHLELVSSVTIQQLWLFSIL